MRSRRPAEITTTKVTRTARFGTMSRKPSPINPDQQSALGKCVGAILRDCRLTYRSGSKLLHTSPQMLSRIVAGKKVPTQRFLTERDWRGELQRYNNAVWSKHRDRFEAASARLHLKSSLRHKPPGDERTLGFMLWKIIGGRYFDADKAALALQVDKPAVYAILHGNRRPSKNLITKHDWVARLRAHYPGGWVSHGKEFVEAVERLPPRTRRIRSREPILQSSFGYILWKIIGGPYLSHTVAADVFGLSRHELNVVLHARTKLRLSDAKLERWREALAFNYPKSWLRYKAEFDRRVESVRVPVEIVGRGQDGRVSGE